jgi:hypothetical protein
LSPLDSYRKKLELLLAQIGTDDSPALAHGINVSGSNSPVTITVIHVHGGDSSILPELATAQKKERADCV